MEPPHRIGKTDKISVQLNSIKVEEVKEDNYLGLLYKHNDLDNASKWLAKNKLYFNVN